MGRCLMLMTLKIWDNRNPIIFHLYANFSVPEINPWTPRQFPSPGIFFASTTQSRLLSPLRSPGFPPLKGKASLPPGQNASLFSLITGGDKESCKARPVVNRTSLMASTIEMQTATTLTK